MDNSDQTRHLGVHHMTATKCEEKEEKEKANAAYHLIFAWLSRHAYFSDVKMENSVTQGKPSLSYMSAQALEYW